MKYDQKWLSVGSMQLPATLDEYCSYSSRIEKSGCNF